MAEIWAKRGTDNCTDNWFRVCSDSLITSLAKMVRFERDNPEYTFRLEVLDA